MQIVGIGNLVCDLYYQDKKLIGLNGGKSFANIIFNLANMGMDTKIIGNCGKDIYGNIAIKSLIKAKVDINQVKYTLKTNLFYIDITNKITQKRSFIDNNKQWEDTPIDLKLNKSIIVIDSIRYLEYLDNQMIMLDIGYFNELKYINDINKLLTSKIEIVNMNQRVAKYLVNKLELEKSDDLFYLMHTKILIITKGKKGADFYYANKKISLPLKLVSKEIDSNGAGDIFFASIIHDYINNNYLCNKKFIINSFKHASLLTSEVVKVIGARSYYQELYKL